MASEAPRLPGPLAPGTVIDGFRLEEHLHRGGMAHLWRVVRVDDRGEPMPDDGLPMIMKVPRMQAGDDPTTVVGFEVEQMIMPVLSGPHVPRFVARGDFTRQPYIVMERIAGASLRARFEHAPLPVDEVVEVGWKVATALHDLHRQHVVHLDVKPSNVMFREGPGGQRGEAVLVDFGLSRHDQLPDLLEEEFELPMGTGPYMSPEQVQRVRNDPRSDLFALGVLLYHLATGQRPFGAPTTVRGLRRRLYREPVPPRVHRPELPPWLQEIILRCLEVQPQRRHQSAAQLAFELRNPDQVALTERARRLQRSGTVASMRRWLAVLGSAAGPASTAELAARSPMLLAAVDVAGATPQLLEAVRHTVHRLLQTEPGARLACLTVMRASLIGIDGHDPADGGSRHVNLLVQLKHWAQPLARGHDGRRDAPDGRITMHVIEASDAASAIVDYARKNQVDHIVIGARSSGGLRRYLGSVSAHVAAEADCTVTVVRV